MDALVWVREYEQQPIRPVYAVFGDDAYLIRESIQRVVKLVFPAEETEAAISRFPGAQTPLASVLDEVRTLPFFTRRRLVIVEDADPFVTKYRKELETYVESPYQSGILLLQVKQWPAATILAKLVDKLGLAIDCSSPREGELAAWVVQLAGTRCDAQLDPDAARLLVELIGPEAGILAAEVEKLAVYAGESRRIERRDVARLVGAGRVETIWKTLDAAMAGQGRIALEHLDNLLASREDPILLLAAMSASLLKIHHAGHLRAARLNLDDACRLAGIPAFAVDKTRRQHAHLGPSRVDHLPAMLLRADLDLKGGSSLDPRVVLERLLVRLALPRTD
ncbi:MAG: DNA polymerase III subunit delta [Isosphaerales bacterium]